MSAAILPTHPCPTCGKPTNSPDDRDCPECEQQRLQWTCPGCYAGEGEECAPDCIDAYYDRHRREIDDCFLYDDNGDEEP